MIIHKYIDGTYQRAYTLGSGNPSDAVKELRGMGEHPSDDLLASVGWYPVAGRPPSPGEHYTWQAADPPYALVDGVSTPQGEWVPIPLKDVQAAAIARVKAATTAHIEAVYPPYWQRNADGGRTTADEKSKMDSDILECITEETRVEQAITDAVDTDAVAAAEASLALPEIARYDA